MTLLANPHSTSRASYLAAYNHIEKTDINVYHNEFADELLPEDTIEHDHFDVSESYIRAHNWLTDETFNHRHKGTAYFPNDFANFNDNKQLLSIDLSFLDLQSTLNITSWDAGIYCYFKENDETLCHHYLAASPIPLWFIVYYSPCFDWYSLIPDEIRRTLVNYKHHEFTILYLTSHYPEAYELFVSAPTLFWLMVCTANIENTAEIDFINLLKKPRTAILEYCKLPGTKSALKLIKKLKFTAYNHNTFTLINEFFTLASHQTLSHHQVISEYLIKALCLCPQSVFSYLFDGNEQDHHLFTTIDDCLKMENILATHNTASELNRCNSIKGLRAIHASLVTQLNLKTHSSILHTHYPAPPLQGNELIIPIRTGGELVAEGTGQQHCLISYHASILTKQYYAYTVLEPERATLGLTMSYDGNTRFDQLMLKNNHPASDETKRFVEDWFCNARADSC